jgi:hypothetical protein
MSHQGHRQETVVTAFELLFEPVTILTEDEKGQTGWEEHKKMSGKELKERIEELEKEGWAVQEVQVDESQYAIPWYDMFFK